MSSTNFLYFPDLFEDVVIKANELIQADATLTELQGVNLVYEFGTYKELTRQHDIKNTIDGQKYPLVWLVWEKPNSNRRFDDTYQNRYKCNPLIYISTRTEGDIASRKRYNEKFKAILYPIWQAILKAIRLHGSFNVGGAVENEVDDHFFWGENSQGENVLFDYLDNIELKLHELEVMRQC